MIDIDNIHLVLSEFNKYFLSAHLIMYKGFFRTWPIWARMKEGSFGPVRSASSPAPGPSISAPQHCALCERQSPKSFGRGPRSSCHNLEGQVKVPAYSQV